MKIFPVTRWLLATGITCLVIAGAGVSMSSVCVAAGVEPLRKGASTRSGAVPGKSVAGILRGVDMSDPAARDRAVAEMRQLDLAQRAAVAEKARLLGIPLRHEDGHGGTAVVYDFLGEEPCYRSSKNANAAVSSGANLLGSTPYDLTGTGVKVGLWDQDHVRITHQELAGRVSNVDGTTVLSHATHAAGTIGASGMQAEAKGMAPQATIESRDWDADFSEMVAVGAISATDSVKIPVSAHPYGYDAIAAYLGRYESVTVDLDASVAAIPCSLPFWAAGNEQDDFLSLTGGYQSITMEARAKNVVTVGAVSDAVVGGVRNSSAATITSYSSMGPCDDGRIKPDLVANGVDVYSCASASNIAYATDGGTSVATASAAGSAALLVQLYAREFSDQRMAASMMKALLIHTADDLGNPGPDYTYGWGLINVKAAADVILAHKNHTAAPRMIGGSVSSTTTVVNHTFLWDGGSPIRATLCWTDPAGDAQTAADSRTPNLKHNLDLKITAPDGSTVIEPFVMPYVGDWSSASMGAAAIRGKNNVDNVEQVYLPNPVQAGAYTVTVSLDGSLTTGSQAYSLVLTGVADPVIAAAGSPGDVFAIYGSSSSVPASFSVSGSGMGAGILVTPPAGFEVSKTPGGGSGYAAFQTVGTAGTISPTTLYLRLAEGIAAGAYSGNITLTSSGAASVSVASGLGVVSPKPVTVTATNRVKAFGNTLVLGAGQSGFYAAGLVGSEWIGSVSLAAGGGTAAYDAPGSYPLTPTAAAGGDFSPANYQISYASGVLTVEPVAYATWLLAYPELAQTDSTADPDGDGQNNLMEYFSGTHPGLGNGPLVTVARPPGFLILKYRRARGLAGVSGIVRWSANPADSSWSSSGVTETAENLGAYENVTATLPLPPGTPRRFMRLEVTQ